MAKKTKTRARTKPAANRKASARKPATKKPRAKKTAEHTHPSLNGWITHTEFASSDPDAMRDWLVKVLGWKFRSSFPMPDGGEYLLYMYSDMGGGGIRTTQPGEDANTVPYVQVASVKTTFAKALRAGAVEMIAPDMIADDLWIACVRTPGGVAIGFAGPK
jgi:predicted enzyme related to lactoylglutathione lyase